MRAENASNEKIPVKWHVLNAAKTWGDIDHITTFNSSAKPRREVSFGKAIWQTL